MFQPARQVQHIANQAVHLLNVALHAFNQGGIGGHFEQFQRQPHARQRGAQVVRHTGQQGGAGGHQVLHLLRHGVKTAAQGYQFPGAVFRQSRRVFSLANECAGLLQTSERGGDTPRQPDGKARSQQQAAQHGDEQGQPQLAADAGFGQAHPQVALTGG